MLEGLRKERTAVQEQSERAEKAELEAATLRTKIQVRVDALGARALRLPYAISLRGLHLSLPLIGACTLSLSLIAIPPHRSKQD